MANPIWNGDNRFVVQPAETSADTLQITANTLADVLVTASSAAAFSATRYIPITINGTVYYIAAAAAAW